MNYYDEAELAPGPDMENRSHTSGADDAAALYAILTDHGLAVA